MFGTVALTRPALARVVPILTAPWLESWPPAAITVVAIDDDAAIDSVPAMSRVTSAAAVTERAVKLLPFGMLTVYGPDGDSWTTAWASFGAAPPAHRESSAQEPEVAFFQVKVAIVTGSKRMPG